jgi:prepilin-type N-terminal cleavage/methylation domain-containing protein
VSSLKIPKTVSSVKSAKHAVYSGPVGFTLIELLVVIAIIVILASLVLPVNAKTKRLGKRIICVNNQRQQVIGSLNYLQDDRLRRWAGTADPSDSDVNWLFPNYIGNLNVFVCPAAPSLIRSDYYVVVNDPDYLDRLHQEGPTKVLLDLGSTATTVSSQKTGTGYWMFGFFGGQLPGSGQKSYAYQTFEGFIKTEDNILSRLHVNRTFGLEGQIVGPSDTLQTLCADRKNKAGIIGFFYLPEAHDPHGVVSVASFCDGSVRAVFGNPWQRFMEMYERSCDYGLESPSSGKAFYFNRFLSSF